MLSEELPIKGSLVDDVLGLGGESWKDVSVLLAPVVGERCKDVLQDVAVCCSSLATGWLKLWMMMRKETKIGRATARLISPRVGAADAPCVC